MKIGDEIYVHGYVDEIRKDTVIIRNDGGHFGTALSEMREATQEEREGVDEYINRISDDVREEIGVGKNYNPQGRTVSLMVMLGDVLKVAYDNGYADGLSDRVESDYDRVYNAALADKDLVACQQADKTSDKAYKDVIEGGDRMKAEKIITKTEPINIEIDKITLLSTEEYIKLGEIVPRVSGNWWLRSPGNYHYDAAFVFGEYGYVDENGENVDVEFGVRPALNISNLQSLNLKAGDKIMLAGHKWTIVSDGVALCDEVIGKCAFREDWEEDDANENEYEQSDIKKWLEKWAHDNGLLEATHGE